MTFAIYFFAAIFAATFIWILPNMEYHHIYKKWLKFPYFHFALEFLLMGKRAKKWEATSNLFLPHRIRLRKVN